MRIPESLRGQYERFRRFGPLIFFAGGFTWDYLTLTRIDALLDNILLVTYVSLLTGVITVSLLHRRGLLAWGWLDRYGVWLPFGIQFLLGALLSANVIFYARSATLSTGIFMVVLVGLLVANEFVHGEKTRAWTVLLLYYMALLSFLVLFVPVILRSAGYFSFVVSSVVALGVACALLWQLVRRDALERRQSAYLLAAFVGITGIMHVLYQTHLIPPVPLALRHAAMYQDVVRSGDRFILRSAAPDERFRWPWQVRRVLFAPGEPVYCFAAVFAPTALHGSVAHRWEQFAAGRDVWETTDVIAYDLQGGRDAGYRGFTFKRNMEAGLWRVSVETEAGAVLGRVRFELTESSDLSGSMRTRFY